MRLKNSISYLKRMYDKAGLGDCITYESNQLRLQSEKSSWTDWFWTILLILSIGLLVWGTSIADLYMKRGKDLLFVVTIIIGLILCGSRSDNIVTLDYTKKSIRIKKRFFLLGFIPSVEILFKDIQSFNMKRHRVSETPGSNVIITVTTHHGIFRTRRLIDFSDADKELSLHVRNFLNYTLSNINSN